jgi:hypothetical protein
MDYICGIYVFDSFCNDVEREIRKLDEAKARRM